MTQGPAKMAWSTGQRGRVRADSSHTVVPELIGPPEFVFELPRLVLEFELLVGMSLEARVHCLILDWKEATVGSQDHTPMMAPGSRDSLSKLPISPWAGRRQESPHLPSWRHAAAHLPG